MLNTIIPEEYIPEDSIDAVSAFKQRINALTQHILKPTPKLTGSEWANKYFYLPHSIVTGKLFWYNFVN